MFFHVFYIFFGFLVDISCRLGYNSIVIIVLFTFQEEYKMKWTSLNDIREMYLSFFESKGHLRHKSFPLVPQNDKSILLINAGMTPLKKYFTGELEPPRHRMTTCQK